MKDNAGFWRRVLAYLIDIISIVIVVAAVFYFFYGFDEVIKDRFSHPNDFDSRVEFLRVRNQIRDISFALWILYSIFFECSQLQATFGKLVKNKKQRRAISLISLIILFLIGFVSLFPYIVRRTLNVSTDSMAVTAFCCESAFEIKFVYESEQKFEK